MSIIDKLSHRKNSTAQKLTVSRTYDSTIAKWNDVETWTTIDNCIFWKGSYGQKAVAEKIKNEIEGTACFDPDVELTGIERLKINGIEYVVLNDVDNIANLDEVQVVYLKKVV